MGHVPQAASAPCVLAYTKSVTTARDYEDMHHLVDRLPPAGVERLRVLAESDPELSRMTGSGEAAESPTTATGRGLSFVGSIEGGGPPDLARRHKDYLREYFDRPA